MTELDAIVGIYGAVDEAVQTDREARARVSRLLPLYNNPVHWYEEFKEWLEPTRDLATRSAPLFPPLEDALEQLADSEPEGRMRARRLFAIALGMRASDQMRDPKSKLGSLAMRALTTPSLAGKQQQARRLYKLLASDDLSASQSSRRTSTRQSGWWDEVITIALSESMISSSTGLRPETGLRPQPCSGRLVRVPSATGPVAALETQFETDEIGFDAATRFIEPVNWKKCMPYFWCEMSLLGPGVLPTLYRYLEVVSDDCPRGKAAPFWAETHLLFNFMWLPDKEHAEVALTNYELTDGRPLPGDLIRVDEGTLLVSKVGSGQTPLRITTTKRIQFNYPFSSEALALIMCALGYSDVVGDLLYCAATHGSEPGAGTEFPGESPETAALGVGGQTARGRRARSACGECDSRVGELMQETADIWTQVLRDGASALQRGAGSGRAGARARDRGPI